MTLGSILGTIAAFSILLVLGVILRPRRFGSVKSPALHDHLERAEAWLEANDYHVIKGRQEAEWIAYYDKDEFRKLLSVDFIARKGADYFAVKVTHTQDMEVSGLRLREEWFPLWNAFGVKGILHLDVAEGKSHTIDFELKTPRYVWFRSLSYRSGWLAAGALIMFAWLHRN